MSDYEPTPRSRVRRLPDRGHYDKSTIYPILDESLICFVAFAEGKQPFAIPTLFARDGDELIVHGASTSRMIRHLQKGHEVCITVTLLDGLVLARSVFEHSVNYRSAVVFGRGRPVVEETEKLRALQILTERLLPGRWNDARQPNKKELKATGVARVQIESASAKDRSGPPNDPAEDMSLPVWAGVIPIATVRGRPVPAPDLTAGIPIPGYLKGSIESK